jgi:guanylate kinase
MAALSQKEQRLGKKIIDLLTANNPRLSPLELSPFISAYDNFMPLQKSYGLWPSAETMPHLVKNYFRYDKVALLISGVAAGGKDSLREEIETLYPDLLFKLVTGTSRKPREDEVEGKDYYFFESAESFQSAVRNEKFIEWVQQGERFYGLPEQSLLDGLKQPLPVICTHVEMSAWSKVEKFLASQTSVRTFVIKLFVLPYMTFAQYKEWLSNRRDDLEARLVRTGWEIAEAPLRADFIVTNRIGDDRRALTYTAQAVVNHTLKLLTPEKQKQFESLPMPFIMMPEVGCFEDVIKCHDSVM